MIFGLHLMEEFVVRGKHVDLYDKLKPSFNQNPFFQWYASQMRNMLIITDKHHGFSWPFWERVRYLSLWEK